MIKKKRQKPINDVPTNIIAAAISLRRFICRHIDLKNYPARASATYFFQKSYSGLTENDPTIVYFIIASLHLASKIYDESRPLNVLISNLEKATQEQSIIDVLPAITHLPSFDEESRKTILKNIVSAENDIIYRLDFCFRIQLPYPCAQHFARVIAHWHIPLDNQALFDSLSNEIYNATYILLTDLQSSPIFYKYPPDIIAQAAIHVTFEQLKLPIVSTPRLPWYGVLLPFRDLVEMNEAYQLVSEYVQTSNMITPPPLLTNAEDLQLRMKEFFITPLECMREIDEMCPPPPIELMQEISGPADGFNNLWTDHLPSIPPPPLEILKQIIPPSTVSLQRQKSDLASILKEKQKKKKLKQKQKQRKQQKQQQHQLQSQTDYNQQQINQKQQIAQNKSITQTIQINQPKQIQNQSKINDSYIPQMKSFQPWMQHKINSTENQSQQAPPVFEPDEILITHPNHTGPPPPPPSQMQFPNSSSQMQCLPPPPSTIQQQQCMQNHHYFFNSYQPLYSYSYDRFTPQPQNHQIIQSQPPYMIQYQHDQNFQCKPPYQRNFQNNKYHTPYNNNNNNNQNQKPICNNENDKIQNIPKTKKRKRKRKNRKKQQNESSQKDQQIDEKAKATESPCGINDKEQNHEDADNNNKNDHIIENSKNDENDQIKESEIFDQSHQNSNKKQSDQTNPKMQNNQINPKMQNNQTNKKNQNNQTMKSNQINQSNQNNQTNQKKKRKRKRNKKNKNNGQNQNNLNDNQQNGPNPNNSNINNMNQNQQQKQKPKWNSSRNNRKSSSSPSHKFNQNYQAPPPFYHFQRQQPIPQNCYSQPYYQQCNHSYPQQNFNQYDPNFRFNQNQQQQIHQFNYQNDQLPKTQINQQGYYQNFNQFRNQSNINDQPYNNQKQLICDSNTQNLN